MRASLLTIVCAGLAIAPGLAKADTFGFSLSGAGVSTSGQISATANGSGVFTITNIAAPGITGVIVPNTSFFSNDNLLFANPRVVDVSGLGFTENFGGSTYLVNLYSANAFNPPSNIVYYADTYDTSGNFLEEDAVAFTVVTPEPSSLMLLGTGVLAVATQLRRRIRWA